MTEPRAVVPGYIRAHLLMTAGELAAVQERLARFAQAHGYTLGTVYVEHVDQSPAAFRALVEAVQRDQPQAVLVPSALHLAVLGLPPQIMHYLQVMSGARVLLAEVHEPAESGDSPHRSSGSAT